MELGQQWYRIGWYGTGTVVVWNWDSSGGSGR